MNEAGEQRRLPEQVAGAAQSLVDRLRRRFGGENAQQLPNPADIAAAEAALGIDTPEAAARLRASFPERYPTQAAAQKAVEGMGAGINQDRRADGARAQRMEEITELLDRIPGAGQSSSVDDILAQMDALGKKP